MRNIIYRLFANRNGILKEIHKGNDYEIATDLRNHLESLLIELRKEKNPSVKNLLLDLVLNYDRNCTGEPVTYILQCERVAA